MMGMKRLWSFKKAAFYGGFATRSKMTKIQKIWLCIFIAMFALPELLWSPVGNFVYELYQNHLHGNSYPFRRNFLDNPDHINALSTILFIQLAGLVFLLIYLLVIRKSIGNQIVLWISWVLLLAAAVVVFFLFGFSVSLRHIGF